jgi:hypothetical protein
MRRLLKPGGQLLLSTPNKAVTSPEGPPSNPWHAREYLLPDLLALIRDAAFESIDVFCQGAERTGLSHKLALKVVTTFPQLCQPERWWDRLAHGNGHVRKWDGESVPTIWVLSCR